MLMLIACRGDSYYTWYDFNTSHVNVNQPCTLADILGYDYFNTSHVNVNPPLRHRCKSFQRISIHLMLMLIIGVVEKEAEYSQFQYISC